MQECNFTSIVRLVIVHIMRVLKRTDDVVVFENKPRLKEYLFGYIGRAYKYHPVYYSIVLFVFFCIIFVGKGFAFTFQNILLLLLAIPTAILLGVVAYYIFVYPYSLNVTLDRKNNVLTLIQNSVFQNSTVTLPIDQIISIRYQPSMQVFNPYLKNQIVFNLQSGHEAYFTNYVGGYGYALMLSETAQTIGDILSVPVHQSKFLT